LCGNIELPARPDEYPLDQSKQSLQRAFAGILYKPMPEDIYDAFPIPEHVAAGAVIQDGISNARRNLPPFTGSGHLEQDIGQFLAQSIQVLDFLAKDLTGGEQMNAAHLNKNADHLLMKEKEENDLSESGALDKLFETRSALRRISRTIQGTATEVRHIWDGAKDDSLLGKTPSLQPETPPHEERLSSPASSGSRGPAVHANIESREEANSRSRVRRELSDRGKGSYTCKMGRNCDKGGVNPDGSLVVFERNSDYRSHVSKHSKPFKCKLPGCPNVKGFARQDQLKRHQSKVPHNVCHDSFGQLDWAL
jgi:hypothetical protein